MWVDLYEVASMANVAARLDDAIAKVPGRFDELASKLAAAASIHLGVVSFELRTPGRSRLDPQLMAHGLLEVLTRTAAEAPTVVIIDEFAGISRGHLANTDSGWNVVDPIFADWIRHRFPL